LMHRVAILKPTDPDSLTALNDLLADRWQVLGAVVLKETLVVYTLGRPVCEQCGADLGEDDFGDGDYPPDGDGDYPDHSDGDFDFDEGDEDEWDSNTN
jgi:hypothetical protein